MTPTNICARCGKKMYGEFDYRKIVCDKCNKELDKKVKYIEKMLSERKSK